MHVLFGIPVCLQLGQTVDRRQLGDRALLSLSPRWSRISWLKLGATAATIHLWLFSEYWQGKYRCNRSLTASRTCRCCQCLRVAVSPLMACRDRQPPRDSWDLGPDRGSANFGATLPGPLPELGNMSNPCCNGSTYMYMAARPLSDLSGTRNHV
jgi:hypothetical protein